MLAAILVDSIRRTLARIAWLGVHTYGTLAVCLVEAVRRTLEQVAWLGAHAFGTLAGFLVDVVRVEAALRTLV